MDCFDALKIQPSATPKTINLAYGKSLQNLLEHNTIHFPELRAHYINALKLARLNCAKPSEQTDITLVNAKLQVAPVTAIIERQECQIDIEELAPLTQTFLNSLKSLYASPKQRGDVQSWKALFANKAMHNGRGRAMVEAELLRFLFDHYHIPHFAWEGLDELFMFLGRQEKLLARYENDHVNRLCYFVSQRFRIASFENAALFANSEDLDAFLNARSQASQLIANEDFKTAFNALNFCLSVCPNDIDTRALLADALYLSKNYNDALSFLLPLNREKPQQIKTLSLIGRIYNKLSSWELALENLSEALSLSPHNFFILY